MPSVLKVEPPCSLVGETDRLIEAGLAMIGGEPTDKPVGSDGGKTGSKVVVARAPLAPQTKGRFWAKNQVAPAEVRVGAEIARAAASPVPQGPSGLPSVRGTNVQASSV